MRFRELEELPLSEFAKRSIPGERESRVESVTDRASTAHGVSFKRKLGLGHSQQISPLPNRCRKLLEELRAQFKGQVSP